MLSDSELASKATMPPHPDKALPADQTKFQDDVIKHEQVHARIMAPITKFNQYEKIEIEGLTSGVFRLFCSGVRMVSATGKYAVLGVKFGFSDSAGVVRSVADKICPSRTHNP